MPSINLRGCQLRSDSFKVSRSSSSSLHFTCFFFFFFFLNVSSPSGLLLFWPSKICISQFQSYLYMLQLMLDGATWSWVESCCFQSFFHSTSPFVLHSASPLSTSGKKDSDKPWRRMIVINHEKYFGDGEIRTSDLLIPSLLCWPLDHRGSL